MALALALAAAAFAALSLRLPSLVSTILAAYLALVAQIALATWALTPFDAITQSGLAVAEAVLLAGAVTAWWLHGRPGVPVAGAAVALRRIVGDPLTLLFLAVAAAALVYELLLALTVPPNNWDSLTYHLARAAVWQQDGGVHWIANAPTARMNEFQPLAEQEILFLFVATGSTVLFALPQYLAQLAILVAVFGASRRLGFDERAAACSAALLATFSLVALQATTAQNDLVAASFPVVAACLLLGGGGVGAVLAGVAVGLGLGVKLTTGLAIPVLAWLAWTGGRRTLGRAAVGVGLGLLLGGVWGYVRNLAETGHVLGHGQGRVEATVTPSVVGTIHTAARVVYRSLDLSAFSDRLVAVLAVAGLVAGIAAAVVSARRRAGSREAVTTGALVAAPLLAPLLVVAGAAALAWATRLAHIPVHSADVHGGINRFANEDYAGFGPLGALALVAAPLLAVYAYALRRADVRHLALALALPSFVVLLAVYAEYNIFLTRFLLVPAALTAPLFARFFDRRAVTATILVAAAFIVGLTLARDLAKPLNGPVGRPWDLTRSGALDAAPAQPTGAIVAAAVRAYDRRLPARACVGAVLGPDEPSYLLWGPDLRHRIHFLPSLAALEEAQEQNLDYVVISTGENAPVADRFTEAGWRLEPLGTYWTLAVAPGATIGDCNVARAPS